MLRIVASAQTPRAHDAAQIALDQRHVGALHRHVGAGAHGDADVGLRQRRRVVDAVAGHGHDAPFLLQALHRLGLLLRQHLGDHLVDAELPAPPPRPWSRLSPVSITMRSPSACSSRIASAVVSLIGSATPSRPADLAVDDHEHHRLAVARAAARRDRRARRHRRRARRAARDCRARRGGRRRAAHALAGDRLRTRSPPATVDAARSPRRRRSRRPADARWRARGSRRAAAAPVSSKSPAVTTETSCGLPSVSVPVLSTTSVSTLRSTSIASAFRNSTPAVAPLPVATMIDIGVARPSAQGQAMISTATALTSA